MKTNETSAAPRGSEDYFFFWNRLNKPRFLGASEVSSALAVVLSNPSPAVAAPQLSCDESNQVPDRSRPCAPVSLCPASPPPAPASRMPAITKAVIRMGDAQRAGERTIRELVIFNDEEITDDRIEARALCPLRTSGIPRDQLINIGLLQHLEAGRCGHACGGCLGELLGEQGQLNPLENIERC